MFPTNLSEWNWKALAGVLMRLPGLFIIDYWWKYKSSKLILPVENHVELVNCIFINFVLLHGFLLLLLPIPCVQALYRHLVCGALLLASHFISDTFIKAVSSEATMLLDEQLLIAILHITIVGIVTLLLRSSAKPLLPVFALYIAPVMGKMLDLPIPVLNTLHNTGNISMDLAVFIYVCNHIPSILQWAKVTFSEAVSMTELQGWMSLLTFVWNKIFVPTHFLFYWLIVFSVNMVRTTYNPATTPWDNAWYMQIINTASLLCDSPVSLLATAVTVSYISFLCLILTKVFLDAKFTRIQENVLHNGWTEGVTFITLSLLTSLIDLKPIAKTAVFIVILFIVLSSLLQSMLELTEPAILALSTSQNKSILCHVRAFSLAIFLFVFPIYLTLILYYMFPIDFWIMIILSSYAMTSFQDLDVCVVYVLFLYDSYKTSSWELLDDAVYYTRAIHKVLEFLVALFVVGVGAMESILGNWNVTNSTILFIHCYFNVWQRLQSGWQSYMLRREAVKKAESLIEATPEMLSELNDVCSICYSSLEAACITPCQHFFHRTCLRKWLYIQDKCPLCHFKISTPEVPVVPAS